jgi:hypothetical protein
MFRVELGKPQWDLNPSRRCFEMRDSGGDYGPPEPLDAVEFQIGCGGWI